MYLRQLFPSPLFFVFFLPVIFAQSFPSDLTTITRTVNSYGSYGVERQQYQTYDYTPYTRFSYAPGAVAKAEGYKYLWDSVERRWRLGAESRCEGDLVGYAWGQKLFLCNCGMFGGVTYQYNWCHPVVPDPRNPGSTVPAFRG